MTPGYVALSVVVYLVVGLYPTKWLNRFLRNTDPVLAFVFWIMWGSNLVSLPIIGLFYLLSFPIRKIGRWLV